MIQNIAIVDDNLLKAKTIREAAAELYPEAEILTFEVCEGLYEHLCLNRLNRGMLSTSKKWLMLIDMQIPLTRNGQIDTEGGFWMLQNFASNNLESPSIIISSDCVDDEMASDIYADYAGSIRYHPNSDYIADELYTLLTRFAQTKELDLGFRTRVPL